MSGDDPQDGLNRAQYIIEHESHSIRPRLTLKRYKNLSLTQRVWAAFVEAVGYNVLFLAMGWLVQLFI